MFSKNTRAHTRDVVRAQVYGTTKTSSLFSIRCIISNGEELRLSCVVSKKVASNAVTRNSVKRKMREALKCISLPSGIYVVYAKKPAKKASVQEMIRDLKILFS